MKVSIRRKDLKRDYEFGHKCPLAKAVSRRLGIKMKQIHVQCASVAILSANDKKYIYNGKKWNSKIYEELLEKFKESKPRKVVLKLKLYKPDKVRDVKKFEGKYH